MARLIFTAGPLCDTERNLLGNELLIGRDPTVDLYLDDPSVSSQHAKMYMEDGAWHIVDMGSSNGSQVNDKDIVNVTLQQGDRVTLGDTIFIFRTEGVEGASDEDHPAESPEPAPATPVPPPRPFAPPRKADYGDLGAASGEHLKLVEQMKERADAIRAEVGKVIIGQHDVLDQVLMCVSARGHALLIGLPGMAKTLMVHTIASVLDLSFKRIQFTPDLMPMDIIGTDVLETDTDSGEKGFRFIRGPIFCNMLLADEINRTPPKTQAALLEAMQEKRITAGNETFELDRPFLVLATQNPIEQEGTYPLPEAQLDRFMFNIWVDYPQKDEEEAIVGTTTTGQIAVPSRILSKEDLLKLQDVVMKIPVSQHVVKYVINLVRSTRPGDPDATEFTNKYVSTGAGPRAGQYLVLAAKARAVLDGRIHVSCNDIRRAAIPVLRHRILTNFAADSQGMTSRDIIDHLLKEVPEPGDEVYQLQG